MRWVSMTVSITPCWKRPRRILDRLGPALLAWLLCVLAVPALASVELEQLRVERRENELQVHAHLKLELGPAVEEALAKGVAVYFVAEAELMRDRWYWYDRKLAQVSRHYRLVYQPLTRLWRLQVASEPNFASGVSSIAQTFDSLQSALDVVRRQSGWKLADVADLDPEARQYLVYRFRLDMSQLPRPLQIGASSQTDWNLSLSRQLRLTPEPRP
jgi:hypothetical protein